MSSTILGFAEMSRLSIVTRTCSSFRLLTNAWAVAAKAQQCQAWTFARIKLLNLAMKMVSSEVTHGFTGDVARGVADVDGVSVVVVNLNQ